MKPFVVTLFAAAFLASSAFAGDNGAQARFQAKFGRQPAQAAQAEPMGCGHDCCRHMGHNMSVGATAPSSTEERFRAKFGRYTPAEMDRQEMAAAMASGWTMMAFAPAGVPDSEERFKNKFGRYTAERESAPVELVATSGVACEHCAKHHKV